MKIDIVEVPRQNVVFGRATCSHSEIGPTLMQVLPSVANQLERAGAEMAGPPFCRYTAWRENDCDIEGGCPVIGEVQEGGEVFVGTLGGMRAVMGEYNGPYEGLGGAHEAIRAYIAENGFEANDAPFEIYMTDPEEEPDPSKWITHVYWPIA